MENVCHQEPGGFTVSKITQLYTHLLCSSPSPRVDTVETEGDRDEDIIADGLLQPLDSDDEADD